MTGWTWAAARRRGTSHSRAGLRCQDASRCLLAADGGTLIAVIADGAGSAEHGGLGAGLASRLLARRAAEHFARRAAMPDDATLDGWIADARATLATAALRRAAAPRALATTLVCALAGMAGAVLLLVGDGAAAVRRDGEWQVPSWPEHGEYASSTVFLTDEMARVRIVRLDARVDALALLSDGLERLALDFAARTPHAPFFETIIRPVETSAAAGADARLSRTLAAFLDGEGVNARTDDDKTLVLAVRR